MKITFFGGYDPAYPRGSVIREGLRLIGADVSECRADSRLKFWTRYPLLLSKYRRDSDCLFVPQFCQKDLPLAKGLGLIGSKKIIFDPLAGRYETKIVDWKRRSSDSLSAWWNARIDRAAFFLSDLVLADTAAHKSYYCSAFGLDPKKVDVLPLGYDDVMFAPVEDFPETQNERAHSDFEVLFYGSFLPLHGEDVIVEAAGIVADIDPGVRFRLIGSGQTLASVKAAAAARQLQNIEFIGWLPALTIPEMIASADVCLGIFGRTEKSRRVVPHKVFQAMGMRKAVITARTPAAEEFFRHGETVYFCEEPLAESLARAILELKTDTERRERIARQACHLVKEGYSPQATARRLIEIIENRFGRRGKKINGSIET